jgi:hypothetical protein
MTARLADGLEAPILVLNARAEARAILYALGEFESFDVALAPLREYAEAAGLIDWLGGEAIEQIIVARFVDILGGEVGHA